MFPWWPLYYACKTSERALAARPLLPIAPPIIVRLKSQKAIQTLLCVHVCLCIQIHIGETALYFFFLSWGAISQKATEIFLFSKTRMCNFTKYILGVLLLLLLPPESVFTSIKNNNLTLKAYLTILCLHAATFSHLICSHMSCTQLHLIINKLLSPSAPRVKPCF